MSQPEPAPTFRDKIEFVALIIVLSLTPFACAPPAPAQDHGHSLHHEDHYKNWMRPHMPTTPCCNARVEVDGEFRGDCYPTIAEPRPSELPENEGALVWWARRHDGKWIEIPKSRIVNYANPDPTGRDAHLCEHHERFSGGMELQLIHCFRPSTGTL